MNPQQPQQGNRLETMLVSEATLVPFPPGEYTISVGGMEHPPKVLANTPFPCMLVTVLPGSRETARLTNSDSQTAWLVSAGEQVALTVANPGALILFTTYRPNDYATTGIRMDIQRANASQPPQPPVPPQPAATGLQYGAPGGQFGAPGHSQPPAGPAFGGQGLAYSPQAPAAPFGGFPSPPTGTAQPTFAQPAPTFGQAPSFGQAPGFGQSPGFAAPQAPRPFTPPAQPAGPAPTMRMAGHVEGEGDVAFDPGQGAGRPGSRRKLEAVALYAEGVALQDIEYAAIGSDGQPMPWVSPPQFTGTRGAGAPMLGFAARLSGEAAQRFTIAYAGSFIGSGPAAAVRNGEFLRSPMAGDPLEALAVILEPKA